MTVVSSASGDQCATLVDVGPISQLERPIQLVVLSFGCIFGVR